MTQSKEYTFKAKRIAYALAIITLLILTTINLFNPSFITSLSADDCYRYGRVSNMNIFGKVIIKTKDKENHDLPYLIVVNPNGEKYKRYFAGDLLLIYNQISEGDVIDKKQGETQFKINGKLINPYNYKCDEKNSYIDF